MYSHTSRPLIHLLVSFLSFDLDVRLASLIRHSSLVLKRSFELLQPPLVSGYMGCPLAMQNNRSMDFIPHGFQSSDMVGIALVRALDNISPTYGQEYAELFHKAGLPDPVALQTLRETDTLRVPHGVRRAVIDRLGDQTSSN